MNRTLMVKIKDEYIDYLRGNGILISNTFYNKVGIVTKIDDYDYFIPLIDSSDNLENEEIYPLKNGLFGFLHLSNMLPVNTNCYTLYEFHNVFTSKDIKDQHGKRYAQLIEINLNIDLIIKKAADFYHSYINGNLDAFFKKNCFDLKKIENICNNYK